MKIGSIELGGHGRQRFSFALPVDDFRMALLESGQVAAQTGRCVQCGICEHNCPAGIPIRHYSRSGLAIDDDACILCGSCVARCPRGTLFFQPAE